MEPEPWKLVAIPKCHLRRDYFSAVEAEGASAVRNPIVTPAVAS